MAKCEELRGVRKKLDKLIRKEFNDRLKGGKTYYKELSEADVKLAEVEFQKFKCKK